MKKMVKEYIKKLALKKGLTPDKIDKSGREVIYKKIEAEKLKVEDCERVVISIHHSDDTELHPKVNYIFIGKKGQLLGKKSIDIYKDFVKELMTGQDKSIEKILSVASFSIPEMIEKKYSDINQTLKDEGKFLLIEQDEEKIIIINVASKESGGLKEIDFREYIEKFFK